MSRSVLITVGGKDTMSTEDMDITSTEDLRSLRHWLIDVDELRGQVELRQRSPRPGELGAAADALMVALGSGAAGALVSVLTSWIRHRTTDVDLTITRDDGTTIEVSGRRLRALDGTQLGAEIDRIAALVSSTRPAVSGTTPTTASDNTPAGSGEPEQRTG